MISNKSKYKWGMLAVILVSSISIISCKKDFLKTDPRSFYTPENLFIDRAGFDALLLANRKQLRHEFYFSQTAICSEYSMSDLAVNGCPDAPNDYHDLEVMITPTGQGNAKISSGTPNYWDLAWSGIKYANTIISRIDNITWGSQEDRNAVLGEAYFHRTYWYYRLVNQFGDVPYLGKEVTDPKDAFYLKTYTRESILKKCKKDMDFAVLWMPKVVKGGQVSRDAAYHLMAKICLQLRDFDGAINAASEVIDRSTSGRKLITTRFGKYAENASYNVLWDLHQRENKGIGTNTEEILSVQDKYQVDGNAVSVDNAADANSWGVKTMRNYVPAWWWSSKIQDPSGARGTSDQKTKLMDSVGRGIAAIRSTNWYNYEIWNDPNDIRHKKPNWWSKEDFYYNQPGSAYYGQHFDANTKFAGGDSIRTLYPFAYNKLYVAEDDRPTTVFIEGGHTNWYVFRIAETYLLRAEAYFWKGDLNAAAIDINVVRSRAQAAPVAPADVTIEYIFAERARELYAEEPRRTELSRVSYIMAQLGRDGYSLANMDTKSWFYDMVMKHNNFYKNEISYGTAGTYRFKPYHVYWPIPQDVINANTGYQLNQNKGYPGAEKNVTPIDE